MEFESFEQSAQDYRRVEQTILYLEKNFRRQPGLKELAGQVGLSEYHFQRLFSRWAGISPKRFLQFLTVEYAKQALATSSESLLDVTYEAGLSSPGRLHDLFVACEAMTPGQFKQKGAGLTISYGFHATPFGQCLLAVTEQGICGLTFWPAGALDQAVADLERRWPQATLRADRSRTQPYISRIFNPGNGSEKRLPLFLKGTNFQLKVWQALLKVPPGAVVSYDEVARLIERPGSARAVGNAVAANPIGFIIPCHRVFRKMGLVGDYQWGPARKQAICGWEAAKRLAVPGPRTFPGAEPA